MMEVGNSVRLLSELQELKVHTKQAEGAFVKEVHHKAGNMKRMQSMHLFTVAPTCKVSVLSKEN